MDFIVQLQWQLHHEISKSKPKFGELITFKKVMNKIPLTAVDEEEIASIIKKKGLELVYEPKAAVYNRGPETIKEFIRQRRRIYAGHLELRKRKKYEASTLRSTKILMAILKEKMFFKNIPFLIIAMILESTGRLLGIIDFCTKKNLVVWKVSETTKTLK